MQNFLQKMDNNIGNLALLYLVLPVIIFIIGYLNIVVGIIALTLLFFSFYKVVTREKEFTNSYNKSKAYYIIVGAILLVWVIYSGIGGFSYQNTDFDVRNAVFNDLIKYDWPVIYDFNNSNVNMDNNPNLASGAGFVYYFAFWLPAAVIGKIFGNGAANLALLLWTFIGVVLIVKLINNYCKRQSYWTIFFLILFSGLDYICYIGANEPVIGIRHLEWWNPFMQYSSNTTLLYWAFNQAIPCWIIVSLLLSFKKPSSILFVSCLVFCYSPFGTFGLIPIAVYLFFRSIEKKNLKEIFTLPEIGWCIAELIIFGTFYTSVQNALSLNGLVWVVNNIDFKIYLQCYLMFIAIEVLLYFVILYKENRKNKLFWLVGIEIMIIPLFQVTQSNDFCMRSSITPLFVLTILMIKHFVTVSETKIKEIKSLFLENKVTKHGIKVLSLISLYALLLAISIVCPVHEIYRSMYNTIYDRDSNSIYIGESIGNPLSNGGLEICKKQFYAINYKEKFFFKYLARINK